MIVFRPPTDEDLRTVAADMRPSDRLECLCISGTAPLEALRASVSDSLWVLAGEVDGEVQCIFGLAPHSMLGEEASPWMLCRKGIERHARLIVRYAPLHLERMLADYPLLSNFVHAGNRTAIRFLKWCGFEFGEAREFSGEAFLPFSMEAR